MHVGLVRRAVHPHHKRKSGHALAPDEADLDLPVARSIRDDRGKSAIDKINVLDPTIADFELTPKGEIDGFQVRLKKTEVLARETKENTIGS